MLAAGLPSFGRRVDGHHTSRSANTERGHGLLENTSVGGGAATVGVLTVTATAAKGSVEGEGRAVLMACAASGGRVGAGRRRTNREVKEFLDAKSSELESLMRKAEKIQTVANARKARARSTCTGLGKVAAHGFPQTAHSHQMTTHATHRRECSPASRPSSSSSSIRSDTGEGFGKPTRTLKHENATVGGDLPHLPEGSARAGGGVGRVKTGHNGGVIQQRVADTVFDRAGAPCLAPAAAMLALAPQKMAQGVDSASAPSSSRSNESVSASCVSSSRVSSPRARASSGDTPSTHGEGTTIHAHTPVCTHVHAVMHKRSCRKLPVYCAPGRAVCVAPVPMFQSLVDTCSQSPA